MYCLLVNNDDYIFFCFIVTVVSFLIMCIGIVRKLLISSRNNDYDWSDSVVDYGAMLFILFGIITLCAKFNMGQQ